MASTEYLPREMDNQNHRSVQRPKMPQIVALTGGKGGVGKTSVAVNLALTMARQGQKVLLLDADTDLANVSILLGQYPEHTLEQAISGECALEDVVMEGPYGLHVIAGASGVQRCMELNTADADAILGQLARLERSYDLVLVDTAAGLRDAGLHMIALATFACVVITPDPASLTDAFSLLKVLQRRGYRRAPGVVVNMAAGASQARAIYRRFAGAVRKHLSMEVEYVGAIWRDESIRHSVELQRPVAMLSVSDPSSRQFRTLADQLKRQLVDLPLRASGVASYWKYRSRQGSSKPQSYDQPNLPRPGTAEMESAHVADPLDSVIEPSGSVSRHQDQCRALFEELDRLVEQFPGDALLQREALRGASALLSRIANAPAPDPDSIGKGYNAATFGSQQSLLERLRSEPDSVRVDSFLSGFPSACDR